MKNRRANTKQQKIPLAEDSRGDGNLTEESVYTFYTEKLYPAIRASLPLLFHRIVMDVKHLVGSAGHKVMHFLLPSSFQSRAAGWSNTSLGLLWEQAMESSSNSSMAEFMLRHFDTNGDGHISAAELLNMTEIMQAVSSRSRAVPQTWLEWFSRSWPLMDWKLGVFLWRSCGGLLIVIAFVSLLPGRLHGVLGKLLRWPVLGLTYFLITVELIVYTIIRVFIRIIETTFANSKHRRLRREMRLAKSYDEWMSLAHELDVSQGRDQWRGVINDETCSRYNWSFIKELIRDMRTARHKDDSLMALAVLQQCTRKNVGGIMSEESFSMTNTGKPKHIVEEFVEEVATTLRWVTEEALKTSTTDLAALPADETERQAYEERFSRKVAQEKRKVRIEIPLL